MKKMPFNLAPPLCEKDFFILYFFLLLFSFFMKYNFPNCHSKCFKIVATLKKQSVGTNFQNLVGNYSQSACQAKQIWYVCKVLICSLDCAIMSDRIWHFQICSNNYQTVWITKLFSTFLNSSCMTYKAPKRPPREKHTIILYSILYYIVFKD